MKHPIKLTSLVAVLCTVFIFIYSNSNDRSSYESFLKSHPYMNRNQEEISLLKKQDRPDLGWELDFLLTMDPETKQPERERLLETYNNLKAVKNSRISSPGNVTSPWVERGPTNVAGRTRAVVFDPNTTNKVWAGSVGGGLWYNNDITDASSNWISVDDFWDNLSITSIAFDPNNSATMYVGTGEGWGTGAARGEGVWKSTDSGATWNQLSATSGYYYVNDIVVRDESSGVDAGVLYVGTSRSFHRGSNHGQNAMNYSSDGGATFTSITSLAPTKMAIAADNRIWTGTRDGKIEYSDDGTTWTTAHSSGFERVAIATAPSDANYIYGLIENNGLVETIIYSDDKGATWNTVTEPADVDNGIPDTDFSRGQAWYDLVIAVDPNDENTVIVGGIDLFRSTDNGANWTQISKWSNNNNLLGLSASLVHADQHAITFKGVGSNEVLFGNDGGVYYSSDLANAGTQDAIPSRNSNYNVTQYYACAIHPEAGRDFFLAGSQDNGSQRYTSAGLNATVEVNGGDGAFCFIDQTDPQYQITSYVFNVYDLSTNEGTSFATNLQNDQNTGLFINPADYDDNQDILYSSRNAISINRISGVTGSPSVGNISVTLGSTTSHLRVSPYTTTSTTLFAGTLSGKVFKIVNADASPSSTDITGPFPTGSISCIEIGASEDELLVTFSNYGVTSIWYTSDGGNTWTSKEGDLPDMPVRWALFNPNNRNEVLIATELGVWRTTNLNSTEPNWTSSNSGLANVRTDMLQIRTSDNEVIAATHGRGLFSSNGFQAEAAPSVNFTADVTVGCGSSIEVNFTNLSSANPAPTSYSWSFPGGSPSSSTSETPPTVTYSTQGDYDVTLTATNSIGQTVETKTNYINLGTGVELPLEEGFESNTFPPSCWVVATGINGLGATSEWVRSTENANSGSASAYVEYENVSGGIAEDWLITPELNFENTGSNSLSFYARQTYATDYNSQYHIRVSTTSQTDLSTFTNLVTYTESDFPITSFTQFTVDLSEYDGMSVYLAFVLEQDDGDDWYLDDVSISGISTSISIAASNGFDICEDQSTILSVPSDATTSYQWKLDGNNIDGGNSNEYTPTVSGSYSVELIKDMVTTTSDTRIVTITELPSISEQPASVTKCAGESVTLDVVASGTELTYQWQFEGNNLSDDNQFLNTNSSSLTINAIENGNEGEYTCVITSGICEITSAAASLTLADPVIISTQPTSTSVCEGEEVSLSVVATGTENTYQWYYGTNALTDDTALTGSTTNTLVISSTEISDAGTYSCEIGSICETPVTSEEVTITVEECLGLLELLAESLSVYPNPVKSGFTLDLGGEYHSTIRAAIYAVGGQIILKKELNPTKSSTATFDISEHPAGVYILVISSDEGRIQKQIMKN